MMERKVAVVGDHDSVMGFKTLGLNTFGVTAEQAPIKIHELAKQNYGIIFLTENVADVCAEAIDRYKNTTYPIITIIPGNAGASGAGLMKVKKNVEKAIGFDMLFNNN